MIRTSTIAASSVLITGGRGRYELCVQTESGRTRVTCVAVGLDLLLDDQARQRLVHALHAGADRLADGGPRVGHLQAVGTVSVDVVGRGAQAVDVDVVHDEAEQVHAVLLTCDALGLDGTLDESGARQLAGLLHR